MSNKNNNWSKRKKARQAALCYLYAIEFGGECSEDSIYELADDFDLDNMDIEYFRHCSTEIIDIIPDIDKEISERLVDWNIDRIAKVDLCILRLAMYEILHMEDIPADVSINEAVDLAKTYGASEGAFVNGILSTYYKDLLQNSNIE